MALLTDAVTRLFRSPWMLFATGVLIPAFFLRELGGLVYQYADELGKNDALLPQCFTLGLAAMLVAVSLTSFVVLKVKRWSVSWEILLAPIVFAGAFYAFWLSSMNQVLNLIFAPPSLWLSALSAAIGVVVHLIILVAAKPASAVCFGKTWNLRTSFAAAGVALVIMISSPMFFFAIAAIDLNSVFVDAIKSLIAIAFSVGVVLLALSFFFFSLRVMLLLADWCLEKKKESARFIFAIRFFAVWVFPFTGLCLNLAIPFPMDCASGWYFILTFLTGLSLLLPAERLSNPAVRWAFWVLRWAFFPFTLYFFLLFLPFIPLALPGVLAFGMGLLLFAPSFLMVVHVQALAGDFTALRRSSGRFSLVFAAVLAFMLLPGALTARAFAHRAVLHTLTGSLLQPDSALMNRPPLKHPLIARHVLEEAYAFKNGASVPGLSSVYRRIVFDNLELPDARLKALWSIVCTDEPPASQWKAAGFLDFTAQAKRDEARYKAAPTRGVTVQEASLARLAGDVEDQLTLNLTVVNTNTTSSLNYGYSGTLTLPPAAFVTGLSLKIGDRWEEGRLFERTAAEWVYHQLTKQLKVRPLPPLDPALLTATEIPGHYTLQVFPVVTTREVRISFVVPAGYSEEIRIDATSLSDLPPPAEPICYTAPGVIATTQAWCREQSEARAAPRLVAVVIDAGESGFPAGFHEPAAALRDALAMASPVLAVEAGTGLRAAFISSSAEIDAFLEAAPKREGGCDLTGALRLAIRAARDRGCALDFRGVSSDQGAFNQRLTALWNSKEICRFRAHITIPPQRGYLLGESLKRFVPADAPARLLWPADTVVDAVALPGRIVALPPESRWAKAAAVWSRAQAQADAPADRARRNALIADAREGGVLIPQNSFIVVEERSQWIELEKQERAMLQADTALSVKADAPEALLLLGIFVAVWLMRKRCRA